MVMMSPRPGDGGKARGLAGLFDRNYILDPSTSQPQLKSSVCTTCDGSSTASDLSPANSLDLR